jgi:tRNA-splicing ligase RtcB
MTNYITHESTNAPIKSWTRGVPVEDSALAQLRNTASLPIVWPHVAVMPDVHFGLGATVGSVVPTIGAIVPACVGVDIGCGLIAARTTLTASDLPDNLAPLRSFIESEVPHGRSHNGGKGDVGAWGGDELPKHVDRAWWKMMGAFGAIVAKHPAIGQSNNSIHLGTLGTGNHFIEVCLDEADRVWLMLHSGSRGVGGRIGAYFIEMAKKDMGVHIRNLPDKDLAYLEEGTEHFADYVEAVGWAQNFARVNRVLMMTGVISAMHRALPGKSFSTSEMVVNCHHNYVQQEHHFGYDMFVTRKGAVSARAGELGIIPGSMGAKSFIVRGKGNADSFHSCSHGAGRVMSRTEAKRRFTIEDHALATAGVECRKDEGVLDESPGAYKDVSAVLAAQSDLVDIVHTLKQVVCVKG